jgi:hypothetical protein
VGHSQTSQQTHLLNPGAIPFLEATFSLLPLANFFFKPQHGNTVLESFVNPRSLQAKTFRFLSAQQLTYCWM